MEQDRELTLAGVNPNAAPVVAWQSWLDEFDRTGTLPPPVPRPSISWNVARLTEACVASAARHREYGRHDWKRVLLESGFIGEVLRRSPDLPPGVVMKSPNAASLAWLAGWFDTLEVEPGLGTSSRAWPGRSGPDGDAAWAFALLSGWWDAIRGHKNIAPHGAWMSACTALEGVLLREKLDQAAPWGLAWMAEHRQNRLVTALVEGDPCPDLPEDLPAARRFGAGKKILWSGTVEALIAMAPPFVLRWHKEQDHVRMAAWRHAMERASQARSPQFLATAPSQDAHWARWQPLVRTPATHQFTPEDEAKAQAASSRYLDATRDAWKMALDIPVTPTKTGPRRRL